MIFTHGAYANVPFRVYFKLLAVLSHSVGLKSYGLHLEVSWFATPGSSWGRAELAISLQWAVGDLAEREPHTRPVKEATLAQLACGLWRC